MKFSGTPKASKVPAGRFSPSNPFCALKASRPQYRGYLSQVRASRRDSATGGFHGGAKARLGKCFLSLQLTDGKKEGTVPEPSPSFLRDTIMSVGEVSPDSSNRPCPPHRSRTANHCLAPTVPIPRSIEAWWHNRFPLNSLWIQEL